MWPFKKKKKEIKEEAAKKSSLETIVEVLGYPCEMFPARTPAEVLQKKYESELEQGRAEGFVPVFVTDDILAEYLDVIYKEGYSLERTLNEDLSKGKEYLDNVLENMGKYDEEFSIEEITGEMTDGEAANAFCSYSDFRNKTTATALLRLPTKNPWEVPAYVPFGDWNECPSAVNMTAVCKYWYDKYGAIPAVITHDTLEFTLPKPVPEDEAMQTAKEHFAFSEDRVFQCTRTGTIGEVADCLRKSKVWYFWWD